MPDRLRQMEPSDRRARRASIGVRRTEVTTLEPPDQAGIDQESIEASRLGPASAGVEKSLAAFENFLLLGK